MAVPQHPLFVYGTLLTGESAHSLLAGSLERIQPAVLLGVDMYSLGAYPMLVDGSRRVVGEVCWLASGAYAEMLTRLDRYEGPEYSRQLRAVRVDGSVDVQAWVYIGAQLPAAATLWPSGDWRGRPRPETL